MRKERERPDVSGKKSPSNAQMALACVGGVVLLIVALAAIGSMFPSPTPADYAVEPNTSTSTSPAPATAMSEEEYLDVAIYTAETFTDMINSANVAINGYTERGVSTSATISALKTEEGRVNKLIAEWEAITPPAKYNSLHSYQLSALKSFKSSIGNTIKFFETGDGSYLDKSISDTEEMGRYIQMCQDEIERLG